MMVNLPRGQIMHKTKIATLNTNSTVYVENIQKGGVVIQEGTPNWSTD